MTTRTMSNGGDYSSKRRPTLTDDQISELQEVFQTIDLNGDGKIQLSELHRALEIVGVKIPPFEIRQLIDKSFSRLGPDGALSLSEFSELYEQLKVKLDPAFRSKITTAQNVRILEATSEAAETAGVFHSVREEEQVAFADWINSNLGNDVDLKHLLPLQKSGDDLYRKIIDGLVLCKLINLAVPETIDERAINKKNLNPYTRLENLTLVVNSARAIGCSIVNIDADDLAKSKKHLVLGLVWQIIRIGLFSQIDLVHVPGLARLLKDGETLDDLQRMSAEQILMRWVNYHMENAGIDRRMNNFQNDIRDSELYCYLLKQIAPHERNVTLDPMNIRNNDVRRADEMLKEADKLGCRAFVTADDVANGVYKLNLAFVANLFNTWPGLKPPEELELNVIEETREERTYRNWMNSMGVDPHVNWLYADLSNGLIIFQLYDVIKPNLVDWKKVARTFHKLRGMMDQIQNCNYAVDLGKQLLFSLVGIQGKDIYDGSRTLTLGLVWQLMRAYTLTILANCTKSSSGKLATDREIIEWANGKLKSRNKRSIVTSFQDNKLSDAKVIIDLIDSIHPGVIDYNLVKDGTSHEAKLDNAKYAISCARKIGAKVYALPEDIVEVKPKMVMTVFACLMGRDYMPDVREVGSARTNGALVAEPTTPLMSVSQVMSPMRRRPPELHDRNEDDWN